MCTCHYYMKAKGEWCLQLHADGKLIEMDSITLI